MSANLFRFLGRGWDFPVAPDSAGQIRYADGPEKVRQSIRIILDTEPGERIMRPGFGCGLRRYLMKPNTTAIRALIRHDVEAALAKDEPRIQVRAIEVDAGDDPALVLIQVFYVHLRDGREDNLVYPFYLE
ncbi:MAG: GPW/gp25 family protein [Pyrinomonadaceae bacterium]